MNTTGADWTGLNTCFRFRGVAGAPDDAAAAAAEAACSVVISIADVTSS